MSASFDPPLRLPPTKPEGDLVGIAGGGFDESSISLRFFIDDLVSDELTQLLGVEPSIAYQKGDQTLGHDPAKTAEAGL
jgi:hypothetical protein